MKLCWIDGLPDAKHKGEMKQEYISSARLRKRLIELLEKKRDSNVKGSLSKAGYDCPNWAYKQADLQGVCRTIEEIINLLK